MVPRRSQSELATPPTPAELSRQLRQCFDEVAELKKRLESMESEGLRFISGAAHSILNPLTIVGSYLDLVLSDLRHGLSDEQLSFLRAAQDAAGRLRTLTSDILELAGLEMHAVDVEVADVATIDLLEAACEELRATASGRGVELAVDVDDSLPAARIDKRRTADAIRRVLAYAVAAAPPSGRVTATAQLLGAAIVVAVRDDGSEIAAETLEHLFEPFAEGAAAAGVRRPALTLAVARRQLEACGGSIAASSGAGEGTTFTIHLPTARTEG